MKNTNSVPRENGPRIKRVRYMENAKLKISAPAVLGISCNAVSTLLSEAD